MTQRPVNLSFTDDAFTAAKSSLTLLDVLERLARHEKEFIRLTVLSNPSFPFDSSMEILQATVRRQLEDPGDSDEVRKSLISSWRNPGFTGEECRELVDYSLTVVNSPSSGLSDEALREREWLFIMEAMHHHTVVTPVVEYLYQRTVYPCINDLLDHSRELTLHECNYTEYLARVFSHPNNNPADLTAAAGLLMELIPGTHDMTASMMDQAVCKALENPRIPPDFLERACMFRYSAMIRYTASENPSCTEDGRIAAALLNGR